MSIFIQIINILNDNLLYIGLIIISPAIYRLVYSLTLFLAGKFINTKKDIFVEHYIDGRLVSVTIIKADTNEPIVIKKNNNNESIK